MRNHRNCPDFTGIVVAAVFILVIGLFLGGIGYAVYNESNHLSEGVVIDKDYSPAYMTTHTVHTGKNVVTTPEYYAASYSIRLQGEKDGETVTYWKSVTEQEYHAVDVGDYYPPESDRL